ncbi:thermonuclease family protein [Rubrimonas cliftonensis]|uniref:Endonuclease YncB, thermonuclease family n=1 Tax=Rubrimonas cliftonensis TaxID=89524 RepID=A0A1H4EU16_9RHOB|nr:thermonuclease family protein [Rubrimonas cliftonensis]SEA88098.1 Endonuclease YncB, thermonuclease family [Rubrimonas cliftonensis]
MTAVTRAGLLALIILAPTPPAAVAAETVSGFATVVDGDTIDIGVETVRLFGIDAAEAGQRCYLSSGADWDCGASATGRLRTLVNGRQISCAVRDIDRYGRLVSICSAAGGARDLSAALVSEGLAWAFRRYSDAYVDEEDAARTARRGVWQAPTQPPWDFRAERWHAAAATTPRPGCPIKGNVSWTGERIYHTPWSPWYDRTGVSTARGERWFCDEAEARAAGWRAARF